MLSGEKNFKYMRTDISWSISVEDMIFTSFNLLGTSNEGASPVAGRDGLSIQGRKS